MPKDTKSSGYNKAPACESRGFGHKKEGENFDTPSLSFLQALKNTYLPLPRSDKVSGYHSPMSNSKKNTK